MWKTLKYGARALKESLPLVTASWKILFFLVPSLAISAFAWWKLSELEWGLITTILIILFLLYSFAKRAQKLDEPEIEVLCGNSVEGSKQQTTIEITANGITQKRAAIYHRLKLINTGAMVIKNCSVSLSAMKMQKENDNWQSLSYGEITPLPFYSAYEGEQRTRVDLQPGVPHFLDVVVVILESEEFAAGAGSFARITTKGFRDSNSVVHLHTFPKAGNYLLTLLISSDSGKALEREVVFAWTGKWRSDAISFAANRN